MNTRTYVTALLVCSAVLVCAQEGETILGGWTTELAGPIDDATSRDTKAKAYDIFKKEILGWIEVNLLGEWDQKNRIDALHLERFTRPLADRAKQESKFNGPKWTYAYSLPSAAVAKAAEDWDARNNALAVQTYVQFNTALESRNLHDAYVFGVRTVFYARAHIGPRKPIAGKGGKDFIYETTQELKALLERLSISASDAVLGGKPGFKPDNALTIGAAFDDNTPLAGLKVSIVLHGGPKLATVTTGKDGNASLAEILMPYVANGAFFNVVPNPGAEIDSTAFFEFSDLNLGLSKNLSQTLMFKITRPTYSLEYKMRAASDIVVPRDVADQAFLVKYLRDSCHIDLAPTGTEPDIVLRIQCQVTGYENDATENYVLKSDMQVSIDEKRSPRRSAVLRNEVLQRSYRMGTEPAMGLYFWETVRTLGRTVKITLLSL